jgi:hypothetical protein
MKKQTYTKPVLKRLGLLSTVTQFSFGCIICP